ncbi:MAG: 6,7-dimethyl-8-ribityllumazine synthase [Bacteroides sp.]|nr:6,7-dimethyl-8-ribityllumazine synthase [Bacteroides sp.]MCM1379073.1 6,7-dimethyl-8-ribityllumazine synthase [Bacteroides sp.]MCM1445771.1 6,7-dimethyl-8-ribityllumazine synthase [Prevotella sp.]
MTGGYNPSRLDARGMRIAIVCTQWNEHITTLLADGANQTLADAGADTETFIVPGAIELTYAAQRIIDSRQFDAVIVFGCVIKGETPHFDYVCQSVTQGITALNADGPIPVIFGVLTVLNLQQALDRCGGPAGHKGIEAAQTAISMVDFSRRFDD